MISILATHSAVEVDYVGVNTDLEFGNFVAPTGTDFVLIVATMTSDGGGEIVDVAYGGLTFFEAAPGLQSGGSATVLYYALNPGGAEIDDDPVVHYKSETLTRKGAIYALSGVDQATPINTYVQDNFDVAEGKELTITPTVDGCLLIDCIGTKEQSGYGLFNGDTAVLFDESENTPDGNPSVGGSQYYQQVTAAARIMYWSWSGETYYNYTIIAVQPASTPSTNTNQFFLFFN